MCVHVQVDELVMEAYFLAIAGQQVSIFSWQEHTWRSGLGKQRKERAHRKYAREQTVKKLKDIHDITRIIIHNRIEQVESLQICNRRRLRCGC